MANAGARPGMWIKRVIKRNEIMKEIIGGSLRLDEREST